MIFKSQCSKVVPCVFSSSQDMACETEYIIRPSEDMLNITKPMLDPCGPNDDMWRKFALPLTPPSSPPRTYGESSESEESTDDSCCDNADRLQDVSDNLDSTFDAEDYRNFWRLTEAINIRSKLISDCMWSGEEVRRLSFSSSLSPSKKLSVDIQEDLFPTPCPSPPASVSSSSDCLSSTECVDPTTVFPFSLSSESSGLSSSDSEEEIDVVTIDAKPLKISIGHKRKSPQRPTVTRSTVQRTTVQRSPTTIVTRPSIQRSAVQRSAVNSPTTTVSSPQPKVISPPKSSTLSKTLALPKTVAQPKTVSSLKSLPSPKTVSQSKTVPQSKVITQTKTASPSVKTVTATKSVSQPKTAQTSKTISPPVIRRVMSEPVSPPSQSEKPVSRKTSTLFKDGGDSSDPARRATHNVLERRRRIDLKMSFERLRECVPNLENKEKSPKVVVLRRAADYIDILTKTDLELEGQKLVLQKEKQLLLEKLKKLTKNSK